jgi:hypothetical protein
MRFCEHQRSRASLAQLVAAHKMFTRINRVLRVMLHTRRNAEAWSVVRVEFSRAFALRSEIRRPGGSSKGSSAC